MLSRRFLFPFFIAAPLLAVGQKPVVYKEPRILLLVDGSSSMLQPWAGKENRFAAAGRLIESLMDSMYRINPNVEFGLRLYGQQSPAQDNNCYDTKREVAFSKNNRDQMSLRLAALRPYGVSPIAYSLQRAAEEDLTEEHHYSYSIILLTDGGESCGGDLCAVSKMLEEKAIFFKPYIISMVDYEPLREQYRCLGEYLTVGQQAQMKPTIQTILDAYRLALRTVSETPEEAPRPKPVVPVKPPVVTYEPPAPKPIPPPSPVEARTTLALLPFRFPEIKRPVRLSAPPVPARRSIPALILPDKLAEEPKPVVVAPPAPVPPPPPVRETPVSLTPLAFRFPEIRLPVKIAVPSAPTQRVIPKLALPQPIEIPPPARVTIATLPFRNAPVVSTSPAVPALPRPLVVPTLKRPQPEIEPVDIQPLTFILRRVRIHEMTPPVFAVRTLSMPRLPLPKAIEDPKPTVVATAPPPTPKPAAPKPTSPAKEGPTPVEFNAKTERSSQSGLLVFFTNGKGKYYTSTPQVEVRDSKTGALVKKFFRTTDAKGDPDLQVVPPGTYDVVVTGRSNVMARNIPIGVDEKMNLQMVVTTGSLRFAYTDNPRRPVSEFTASVVRRFADDHNIVKQKTDEEKVYEPGNYYLELNTLPVTRRNLDIDFGGATEIQIAEPGWVQFTNTAPISGKVTLYQPLGDGFASFLKIDITGDPEAQKLRLQPGTYEARWGTGPEGNIPTVMRFQVKSNQTTETYLK